jgi:dihydroorotate dehydrogenase
VSLYEAILRPLLFQLNAERAHGLAIQALRSGLIGHGERTALPTTVFGIGFPNPVGFAAGFDKNAEIADPLLRLGFGFVEVGTITPRPQSGNPRPRLFRLVEDEAIINRLGFNGKGFEVAAAHLGARRRQGIVGVNIGKNRDSTDEVADYVAGVTRFAGLADYLVTNISSPNTPGLRDLQRKERLVELLAAVLAARDAAGKASSLKTPLLVKVAPDLDEAQIRDIADAVVESGVDGLIVGNTTIERPYSLCSTAKGEAGGLSGRPLMGPSTRILAELYKATGGKVPIIGTGGIFTGADAYRKIRAGASLVQLYSGMIYRGPGIGAAVPRELAACLKADGFKSAAEAVGVDSR